MAKAKEQQMLEPKSSNELATAVDPSLVGGLSIIDESAGAEKSAPRLGELKLYQGSATEAQVYGEHKRGDFIDCLTRTSLGQSVRVAVLGGQRVWVKFIEGQKFPVYVHTRKEDVPPGDLVDGSVKNGRGTAAREQVLMIVLVEGQAFPFTFRFKSTAMSSLVKTIQPLEARRGMMKQVTGLYEFTTVDDKGPGGEAYKRLTVRPVGDLPESMRDLFARVKSGLADYYAKSREEIAGSESGSHDDDNIPV